MGSYLYTGEVQFHIERKNISNAFFALSNACETYDGIDPDRCSKVVTYLNDPLTEKDSVRNAFVKIIEMFNWEVTFNDEGDINAIGLVYDDSSSSDDDETLFTLLGPYVTQGSFIEFETQQHGNRYEYRYVFTGTRMIEQEAHYDPVPDERTEEKGGNK